MINFKNNGIFIKKAFNMIEVMISLIMIVIGVIGIMTFFPIGQHAYNKAIGTNNAQDVANQFMQLYASKIKNRWSLIGALPTTNVGDDIKDHIVTTKDDENNGSWAQVDNNEIFNTRLNFYYHDSNNNNSYDFYGDKRDATGIFRITKNSANNTEDFNAALRVWHSPVILPKYNGGYEAVSRTRAVKINVEVSFPQHAPYKSRTKIQREMIVHRSITSNAEDVKGAFSIPEKGYLKFTYHGSEAGYQNGFWISKPIKVEVFESQGDNDKIRYVSGNGSVTTDKPTEISHFESGTVFNFFARVDQGGNGKGYRHYSWADESNIVGNNISKTDKLGFTTTITNVVKKNNNWDVTLEIENTNEKQIPLYYIIKIPNDYINDAFNSASNNQNFPMEIVDPDPITGITGIKVKTNNIVEKIILNYTINNDDDLTTSVVSKSKTSVGVVDFTNMEFMQARPVHAINKNVAPYYDNPTGKNDGNNPTSAHNGYAYRTLGIPYAIVIEKVPGRKWLLGFEDMLGWSTKWGGPDFDYSDIVVTAEFITDDGIEKTGIGNHTISGSVKLSNGYDFQITGVKPNGDFIDNSNIGNGYNGPVIAIWMRGVEMNHNKYNGQDIGENTIIVDNKNLTFLKQHMLIISGEDIYVDIKQENGNWICEISGINGNKANNTDYYIMK